MEIECGGYRWGMGEMGGVEMGGVMNSWGKEKLGLRRVESV